MPTRAQQLNWEEHVDCDRLGEDASASLVVLAPEFRKLSDKQKKEVRFKEKMAYLHNLAKGEVFGATLGKLLIANSADLLAASADVGPAIESIVKDEEHHLLLLRKFLDEKVKIAATNDPQYEKMLEELLACGSFEIQVIVSQLCLEWLAVTRISALSFSDGSPLLRGILRQILADEARHLNLGQVVFAGLSRTRSANRSQLFENYYCETVVTLLNELVATPVWAEYEFRPQACRDVLVNHLHSSGILRFFAEIVPAQLLRYKIDADEIKKRLHVELPQRFLQQTFEKNKLVAG